MSTEIKKEIQLEIAHVLFIDIVAYSKLLITEQHDLVERAGNRRDADRGKATQPARQPAVTKEQAHGSRRSLHERHTS